MQSSYYLELLNSLEENSIEKLAEMYHPSLKGEVRDCNALDDFIFLDFKNEERCMIPNTNGKVDISSAAIARSTGLDENEMNSRRRGVLRGHTTFEVKQGSLCYFRCFSYVHPEVWFEGVCDIESEFPSRINGTLSERKPSELYAQAAGSTLKIYDMNNFDLWAEFSIK